MTHICLCSTKESRRQREREIPVLVSQTMDMTKMPGNGKVNRISVVMGSHFIVNLIGKTENKSMWSN